jgi:lysophospholipase L1-like esterase
MTGADGRAFFFSARLAPGAYQVTVTLGDPGADSVTTVKSETRRLMLESVHAAAGQTRTLAFLVHVRVPQIPGGPAVTLKPRESRPILYVQWGDVLHPFTELDWDEKLTLEFAGNHPSVCSVEITPAEHPITVYLIGDSTMTDQMMEPWTAWGQQLPRWFVPPVVIANYAECGETTASFISEHRWQKVMSEIHAGDWVFMQFGINDAGKIPVSRFGQYFVQFVADTRAHGATPVLVTSQNLAKMTDGKIVQQLAPQADAMRQVAREQNAALIDLNAMSTQYYEALGPQDEPKAFVDGTHHSEYGAYELSKCVVQAIVQQKLPLADHVVADWKTFDPGHPDPPGDVHLPADPQLDPARPGGPGIAGQGPMAAPLPNAAPATRPVGGR